MVVGDQVSSFQEQGQTVQDFLQQKLVVVRLPE
jgi:hypothetical protein